MDPHDLSSPEDQPREPLDALLREAVWPQPDPQSLARLRQRWFELSPARRTRSQNLFRRSMALAAALACLAAGALLWHLTHPRHQPPLAVPVPPPLPAERLVQEEPVPPDTPSPAPEQPRLVEQPIQPPEVAAARPPNAYESLVFLANQRRKPLARRQQADQLVAAAIEELVANPAAAPRAAAAPLISLRTAAEQRLATIAQQSRSAEQRAAIRLLGSVGTRRSIPLLLELSQHAQAHDTAIRSLAALADPALLGRLAAAEQHPLLRRELLAALLKRGDAPSVAVFLGLVDEQPKGALALAVAAEASPLPLETLLGFLHAPQPTQRMAAARVLGHVDDPRIPPRLIQMVLENVYRQEALVALLSSPCREASEFLALARRDPLLVASVQAAHYRFANLP
jgi:hypothetical protein